MIAADSPGKTTNQEPRHHSAPGPQVLRELVDRVQAVVMVSTPSSGIEWCNAYLEQVSGFSFDVLRGHAPRDFLIAPDNDRSVMDFIRQKTDQGLGFIVEALTRHASGAPFWARYEVHPVFDERSMTHKYITVGHDISEQKRREQTQYDFTSMVSHELRTPLSVIAGALEVLDHTARQSLDTASRDLLGMSIRNTRHLDGLVSDLLVSYNLRQSDTRIDLESFELVATINDVLADLQPRAIAGGITTPKALSTPEILVMANEKAIRQVLINLLSNALKFSRPGSNISVDVEQPNGCTRVSVTDQGIGIPIDFQPFVFDRFARAPSVRAGGHDGFGLGLDISKSLMTAMGGSIQFDSIEGIGSTFWFDIPSGR